jgi:hypothetical protein
VDQLVAHPLHGAILPIANETVVFGGLNGSGATLTEKLADSLREDGEVGFEVIAALVCMHVAATAEEDVESLLDASGDYLRVGHEADSTLALQDVLEGRPALQLLLMLSTHSINLFAREFTYYIFIGM